jgi:glycosyltransferase involved in cell wall biosynthesis
MKKICHITSVHKSNDVRIFLKECSSLANAGFETYLVATNCESKVVNGVNIIGVQTTHSSEDRLSRIYYTSKKVFETALKVNADIYHIHDPELLPYALKLKRKGKLVIYDVHEDVPKQILGKYWINKLLRTTVASFFKTYENYVSKKLDYIITATPFIRDRFLNTNSNCIDINNYPLLNELSEETDWKAKSNEICYIGGITAIRGISELLDALSLVENVKLHLAGNFSPEVYRNQIIMKPAWNKVIEYGFVNRQETAKIMAKSKAGIVTFLPMPNHVDAQPNKIFEYMSAGIPVIGSDFPLWKEIIENNNCGICIDPTNPKSIANAISLVLSDDEKAEQMGGNGRQVVLEKYNWGIEEKKLITVYYNLLLKTSMSL